MTPQETYYYIEAMNRLKAQEQLQNMDAIQYPHIKDKDRQKRHKEIFKRAYPKNFEERVLTTKDIKLI